MKINHFIKSFLSDSILYWYYSIARKTYSQIGQDRWVYGDVFNQQKYGYFVEIGSADGITLNNTFLLESKFKWEGICIEANPHYFSHLIKIRQVNCVNACIGESDGIALFESNGLESGIKFNPTVDEMQNNTNPNIFMLNTYTLESIFEQHHVPSIIDYLSIDIEGSEWLALKNFPFEKYKFNSITIERPNDQLRKLFKDKGYVIIEDFEDLDVYYVHQDFLEQYHRNKVLFKNKIHSK